MEQIPLFTLDRDGPRLCTVPDFADAYDVPAQTLYSAVSSGRIAHRKIGGRLYMVAESAEKFMLTYRKYT